MRGSGGGGGGGGGFPPFGGGGGGGMGGAGAGCLAGLLPMLMSSKIGMVVLLVGALCVGLLICTGGGSSLFSGVGGLNPGQPGQQQPGPNDVNSTALAQQCDRRSEEHT